jgi:hypothetical protein
MSVQLIYNASKTASLYHSDNDSMLKIIMGHVASGKTVANIFEVMRILSILPLCTDGVRRGRAVCVRNTYAELESTTLRSWLQWFPEERFGHLNRKAPFIHMMRFTDQFGIYCEFDIYFMSLRRPGDEKKLLSLEATVFYFNEIDQFPWMLINQAISRLTCRYPSKPMLGLDEDDQGIPYYQCVLGDTNPPPSTHWVKKKVDDQRQHKLGIVSLYKQPSALIYDNNIKDYVPNPLRENRQGISDAAMLRMAKTLDSETFKVKVMGQYAAVFDGKPVHPAYKPDVHYSRDVIDAVPGEPLYLGWDFGLTPACLIMQFIDGQLIVLDECYTFDMHIEEFLVNYFIPQKVQKYAPWFKTNNYISTGDPSGKTRNNATGTHCFDVLNFHNIDTDAAETNDPEARRSAFDYHLNRMILGKPGMIVSANAEYFNEGMCGGFRYRMIETFEEGKGRFREVPEKNDYSHLCEGGEYGAMPIYCNAHEPQTEFEEIYEYGRWVRKMKTKTKSDRVIYT